MSNNTQANLLPILFGSSSRLLVRDVLIDSHENLSGFLECLLVFPMWVDGTELISEAVVLAKEEGVESGQTWLLAASFVT